MIAQIVCVGLRKKRIEAASTDLWRPLFFYGGEVGAEQVLAL
jgi:hypothetical protein